MPRWEDPVDHGSGLLAALPRYLTGDLLKYSIKNIKTLTSVPSVQCPCRDASWDAHAGLTGSSSQQGR